MKERRAANGAACMNCGITDSTVVLCHYSGMRQHMYGKGRGRKGEDFYAAPQCVRCHADGPFAEGWIDPAYVDAPRDVQRLAKSELQLAQIVEWHRWRNQVRKI